MTTTARAGSFSEAKRGYDPAEVDAYLDDLRRSFSAELEQERERVSQLEEQLASAKQREEAVHLTLVAATKTKDEMIAAAQRKLDEATADASAEAANIIQQAKYEAFRLVTEAREDADRLVAEVRERADAVPAADAEAAAIVAAARAEADEVLAQAESRQAAILAEARSQAMTILTGAKEDAEATRQDQERIEQERRLRLHSEIEQLERHIEVLRAEVEQLQAAGATAPEPEPVVAAVLDEVATVEESSGNGQRGSFYSRRSAKLPHIGEESGRSALAAMNGLRGHIHAANAAIEEDEDEGERRKPTTDLAAQSA